MTINIFPFTITLIFQPINVSYVPIDACYVPRCVMNYKVLPIAFRSTLRRNVQSPNAISPKAKM